MPRSPRLACLLALAATVATACAPRPAASTPPDPAMFSVPRATPTASGRSPLVSNSAPPVAIPHDRRVVYRRLSDSALGFPLRREMLQGPLPSAYHRVAEGLAPASVPALLQRRRKVFLPPFAGDSGGCCRELTVDTWSRRGARLHQDDVESPPPEPCVRRALWSLTYAPDRFGHAGFSLDYDETRQIPPGCSAGGEGIALCGEPTYDVVDADDVHFVLIEDPGIGMPGWIAYAYSDDAATAVYVDGDACARSLLPSRGCSD